MPAAIGKATFVNRSDFARIIQLPCNHTGRSVLAGVDEGVISALDIVDEFLPEWHQMRGTFHAASQAVHCWDKIVSLWIVVLE